MVITISSISSSELQLLKQMQYYLFMVVPEQARIPTHQQDFICLLIQLEKWMVCNKTLDEYIST